MKKKRKWLSKSEWLRQLRKKQGNAVSELIENFPECCKVCEHMKEPLKRFGEECANFRIPCPVVPTPSMKVCDDCKKWKADMESRESEPNSY